MATFKERLRDLRKQRGLTQNDLANIVKVDKQTISQYERGVRRPDLEKLSFLADVFNVTSDYLLGKDDVTVRLVDEDGMLLLDKYDNVHQIGVRSFPVLGEIACGEPRLMAENVELYVDAKTDIKADYVLYAKGDSMTGARIFDGDIVFIREQPSVENGEIAAVAINDEATLKRCFYYPDKEMLILRPANDKYEEQVFVGEELRQVRILGKAVAFQSDVR